MHRLAKLHSRIAAPIQRFLCPLSRDPTLKEDQVPCHKLRQEAQNSEIPFRGVTATHVTLPAAVCEVILSLQALCDLLARLVATCAGQVGLVSDRRSNGWEVRRIFRPRLATLPERVAWSRERCDTTPAGRSSRRVRGCGSSSRVGQGTLGAPRTETEESRHPVFALAATSIPSATLAVAKATGTWPKPLPAAWD